MRKETNAECVVHAIVAAAGAAMLYAVIASATMGCMAVAGVKSHSSGTNADGSEWSKWEFTQGLDLGISANAIDDVQNTRGIKPGSVQNGR